MVNSSTEKDIPSGDICLCDHKKHWHFIEEKLKKGYIKGRCSVEGCHCKGYTER